MQYMQQYVVPSGTVCNHISMEPRRACYIHENDRFVEKYIAAFEAHRDRGTAFGSIVEKHDFSDSSPILIDMDMRQDLDKFDAGEHLYDPAMVRAFVETYVRHLSKYVKVAGARFFLQEKPSMRLASAHVKCGFHMVCPDIVLATAVQLAVRRAVLSDIADLLAARTTNTAVDCFDERVIGANGWFMYGSSKPGEAPYLETRVYTVVKADDIVETEVPGDDSDYVRLFAIRFDNRFSDIPGRPRLETPLDVSPLLPDAPALPPVLPKGNKRIVGPEVEASKKYVGGKEPKITLERLRANVMFLSDAHSCDYDLWLKVSGCL